MSYSSNIFSLKQVPQTENERRLWVWILSVWSNRCLLGVTILSVISSDSQSSSVLIHHQTHLWFGQVGVEIFKLFITLCSWGEGLNTRPHPSLCLIYDMAKTKVNWNVQPPWCVQNFQLRSKTYSRIYASRKAVCYRKQSFWKSKI